MRMYQSIWERLKTDGTCTISAPPALHARIRKAVGKEKYNDTAYKIQWDLDGSPIQPELSSRIDSKNRNLIHFSLIKPTLLRDL